MKKYRVTRVGRPSPLDWPQAVELVCWGLVGVGLTLSLFLDWTTVGVTP